MLYLGNGNTKNIYILKSVNINIVDSVKDYLVLLVPVISSATLMLRLLRKQVRYLMLHYTLSLVMILIFIIMHAFNVCVCYVMMLN